uniref:AlNc14C173G8067 protein n=1 Tax=Albugo laibachii Nc14 TaxID=890382 RepID=F0WNP6_9STRA|nr:AlNc14C173G8067 [Albugo laibachii Nc14]|eukprot:CCA22937.1 AlNc14C173G8067 [Albugo laibachii Nc14]
MLLLPGTLVVPICTQVCYTRSIIRFVSTYCPQAIGFFFVTHHHKSFEREFQSGTMVVSQS